MGHDATFVQWFPGHMAKTRRLIQENLKLVDLVLELTDARLPQSSRNPDLGQWLGEKPRVILLNKADTADPVLTKRWCSFYHKQGLTALSCDCKTGQGFQKLQATLKAMLEPARQRRAKRGLVGRTVRIMVVGIPNVGKSSLINRMAGGRRAKVEDRPGVTRGRQWVSIGTQMELLDMPGVLWPKFDDPLVGEKLAFTGAVKDDVIDTGSLAVRLLSFLCEHYPQALSARYGVTDEEIATLANHELLARLARKRGMLLPGDQLDLERVSIMLLDEFRGGKLGRITLDRFSKGNPRTEGSSQRLPQTEQETCTWKDVTRSCSQGKTGEES